MVELEDRKQELIRQLDQSRRALSTQATAVKAHADPVKKLRHSFANHRLAWLGGGAALLLLVVKWPKRSKPAPRSTERASAEAGRTGLLMSSLKLAFDVSRPLLLGWATERLAEFIKNSAEKRRPRG